MKRTSSINMRDLAKLAGVSVMTVSRALRNNPKIGKETRSRIKQLASEHGYRVNPLVSAQMASIRSRRLVKFQATIALITHTPPSGSWIGGQKVIDGVLRTGAEMGFSCDVFDLADGTLSGRRLNRILKSRGIQGVVEAPMLKPLNHYDFDFSELTVVSSNSGLLPQAFHRVCPDHYGNMDMLLRKLVKHGFKSPGLMVPRDLDSRFNHLWTSRYLAFQQTDGLKKIPPLMPNNTDSFDKKSFREWFDRHRPDILIVTAQELFQRGFFDEADLEIPAEMEVVKININDATLGFSGINMMSEAVGAACVKLLSQLMYNNEVGIPENPMSILVPGRWVSGKMAPSLDV